MRIDLTSIHVDDQERALAFYTGALGFVVKHDIPAGEFRWLTVVSPEAPDGVALSLEPNDNPASQAYQKALVEQGIPCQAFTVADVQAEYERLTGLGVVFTMEPMDAGGIMLAILHDTCGNLVQINDEPPSAS